MPLNFVAKAAITVALTAANMALTMSRKIEGPRLDNLKFTSGDYGQPLPMVWGMRRMEVPIFWAEDLREVKRRRKTKGGKFNEYTYYGTWAVALAGHEIEAVRRIWFDTHLVYDLSGAGPVTPFDFGTAGADIDEHVAIYLGTADQDPDPRMQATIEAAHGEGSCPAYRDTAYIVFKDIPLEKIGNRIPQVSVEIVGAATPAYPYESVSGTGGPLLAFSPDRTTLLTSSGTSGNYAVIDVAARAVLVSGDSSLSTQGIADAHGYLSDGTILMSRPGSFKVISIPFGSSVATELDTDARSLLGHISNVVDNDGNDWWLSSLDPYFTVGGTTQNSADIFPFDVAFYSIFRAVDGGIWIAGDKAGDTTTVVLYQVAGPIDGPGTIIVEGLTGGNTVAFHYQDDTHDQFIVGSGGDLFAIDRTTGDVLASNTTVYGAGVAIDAFRAIAPGAATFWIGFAEISSTDLSVVRALDHRDWHPGSGAQNVPTIYDPINHALISHDSGTITFNYLDRIGGAGVPLSLIAGDVADMCGIEDYDFSHLTQTITGWSATRGQGGAMLEPLLDAYDSDFRPHDFGIQGIKRTGVTSGSTLATERFVGEPRYSVSIKAELPRAVLFDFADVDADQQPNTVRSDRPLDATSARGEQKIDLTTLALDADEARQLGNRYFRRLWNERKQVSLSLTAQELKLEPGDVRTLELDDDTFAARCVRTVIKADDSIETEWRYDAPTLATLDGSAGAAFDGREPSVVVVAVISKGFVLDVPLLSDSDDAAAPQVYALAAPYADGPWPGATIYQAVDGDYSDELATVTSSASATWGYVSTALPYRNPNVWDRGSSITVTLQTGELTGCTEDAANADPTLNLAAIGADGRWEVVQFTNAVLTGTRTYTVSGFKRGRRGSEWAAELHEASDQFVLLENADATAMGLSEVGTDVSFKPITAGRTTGFPFTYTLTGASLKPYAPCHLEAVKESSGDWTLTWVRRTRVGGAWTSGTSIPLSETSEEYELTLGDGVSSTTVTTTDPTYTWTLASQTSVTGGEVLAGDLEWSVNQQSDAVGDGYFAEATA